MRPTLALAVLALLAAAAEVLLVGAVVGAATGSPASLTLGGAALAGGLGLALALPLGLGWGLVRLLRARGRQVAGARVVLGVTLLLDVAAVALLLAFPLAPLADVRAAIGWMPRQVAALAADAPSPEVAAPAPVPAEVAPAPAPALAEPAPLPAPALLPAPPPDQGPAQARAALDRTLAAPGFAEVVPGLTAQTAAGVGVRWMALAVRARDLPGWDPAARAEADAVLDRYGLDASTWADPALSSARVAPIGRAFLHDAVAVVARGADVRPPAPWADLLPARWGACRDAEPLALEPLEPARLAVRCQGEAVGELRWEAGAWRLHLGDAAALSVEEVDAIAVAGLLAARPPAPVEPAPAAAPAPAALPEVAPAAP